MRRRHTTHPTRVLRAYEQLATAYALLVVPSKINDHALSSLHDALRHIRAAATWTGPSARFWKELDQITERVATHTGLPWPIASQTDPAQIQELHELVVYIAHELLDELYEKTEKALRTFEQWERKIA